VPPPAVDVSTQQAYGGPEHHLGLRLGVQDRREITDRFEWRRQVRVPIPDVRRARFCCFENPAAYGFTLSLIVGEDSLPDCLEVTARTEDGLIMGLSHKSHPVHGVQFHPESIESENGHDLLKNFVDIAGGFTLK